MFDNFFKSALILVIIAFLFVFYSTTQKGRFQPITEYEGSLGIFDTQKGVVYMLDIENDQCTLIKPFTASKQV